MPSIPSTFYRKTKHKKPQHQLYIPGFNPANSCWLNGSWVTVPEAEWNERHKAHHKLFKAAIKAAGHQHYRDAGTPLDKLTEAQRMAYEHFSGEARFDVVYKNGNVGLVGVKMVGNRMKKGQAEWLRERGAKIIPSTEDSFTGKVTDVLKGLDVPADLVSDDTEPRDPWEAVVEQNKQAEQTLYSAFLDGALGALPGVPDESRGFMAQMAFHGLIEKEESIIHTKWNIERGVKDPYDDLDRDVREYVEMRVKLSEAFPEQFDERYQQQKDTHNECARANLGDTGVLFSFVLPKFNDDGTHEPWGDRDVPWGTSR